MTRQIKRLHPSDVVYLIYSTVGLSAFSYNDINHIVTISQLQGIHRKGYIYKTGATVKSNSKTKPNNYNSEWQISKLGILIMNKMAMKPEMDKYKTEITIGRSIMGFFTNMVDSIIG